MSIVMQLQDVAESTRLGPLSGEVRAPGGAEWRG